MNEKAGPKPMSAVWIALGAVLACLLWSTAFAGIKIGLRYMKPLGFAGIRFILAGLLLAPFCRDPRRLLDAVTRHSGSILLVALFQTFLLYGLFFLGMTRISGAFSAILIGSSPVITSVMTHFILPDDRLSGRKLVALALGTIGIVTLTLERQPWTASGLRECWGILMILGACVSTSFGNIVVAGKKDSIQPVALTACQLFVGGVGLFVLSLLVEGPPLVRQPPLVFYGALVWLAFVSAAAFSIWFHLLQLSGAAVSSLNVWKFIIPIVGAAISWAVIPGEHATPSALCGMVSIALAVYLYNR